jgi:hypothetical protein
MAAAVWIIGIVVALFALDRAGLWAESRGWIYWRKVKRKGSAGAALFTLNSVFDPSAHHVAEAREERAMEDEDTGDDDGQRDKEDRLI